MCLFSTQYNLKHEHNEPAVRRRWQNNSTTKLAILESPVVFPPSNSFMVSTVLFFFSFSFKGKIAFHLFLMLLFLCLNHGSAPKRCSWSSLFALLPVAKYFPGSQVVLSHCIPIPLLNGEGLSMDLIVFKKKKKNSATIFDHCIQLVCIDLFVRGRLWCSQYFDPHLKIK